MVMPIRGVYPYLPLATNVSRTIFLGGIFIKSLTNVSIQKSIYLLSNEFFALRIHQNRCWLGLCPRPQWGAYSPRPPNWFQRGRFVAGGNGGEGTEGLGGRGEGRGKGEWGREGKR